ncbi:uncharacterized protein TRIADDRAFT_57734 [Trichoplax adhaerens]|uniref:Uncharacterized protein n=1 Tax=Trichoplax adhaerens TaxID=10228 RepID=B3S096_TRIAD|nr:hypothetical protein TRIADDRAFT_57734 [Trichoplax adhaerens]EDV23971.1 hypothetical protein TRIADDRAFT_57734 [Trichoplax adhaerens]|eukprot:XP_002113497.1 hypothetical protein TRIADDRAFT_57734 [Trichoplax adhaerens]
MGIKYLTSYINANENIFLTRIEVSHQDVVIDGSALVHHLYHQNIGIDPSQHLSYRSGGDYRQFSKRIEGFFTKLMQYKIRAFVIFDGTCALKKFKMDTIRSRAKDGIAKAASLKTTDKDVVILPPMAEMTFIHVLRQLHIPFVKSEKDADPEIAALAEKWQCLVMSKDSDFFIFKLSRGYAPFDKIYMDDDHHCLVCYAYFQNNFSQRHHIPLLLLPLVASFLSNDYLSYEDLQEIHSTLSVRLHDTIREKIISIINWLRNKNITSFDDCLSAGLLTLVPKHKLETLLAKLRYSIQFYSQDVNVNAVEGHLRQEFTLPQQSHIFENDEDDTKNWIINLYRYNRFPSFALDIICNKFVAFRPSIEHVRFPSVHNCTQALRDVIYAILLKGEEVKDTIIYSPDRGNCARRYDHIQEKDGFIKEWDRMKESHYAAKYVKIKELPTFICRQQALTPIPHLHNLRLSDRKDRLQFLLMVFDCEHDCLRELNLFWWLIVASLRYWFKNCLQDSNHLLLTILLVCIINLYYDSVQEFPKESM